MSSITCMTLNLTNKWPSWIFYDSLPQNAQRLNNIPGNIERKIDFRLVTGNEIGVFSFERIKYKYQ